MSGCSVDADCPSVQICYQNASASWLNGDSKCICNTEYGWQGNECEEFGPATYFLVTSAILYGAFALCTFIFGLVIVVQLLRNKKLKSSGPLITLGLVMCQGLFIFLRAVLYLALLFTPEMQVGTFVLQGELTTKGHELIIPLRVIISLGIVFTVLPTLHMSLLWLSIAQASQKLSSTKKDALRVYPKVIFGIEGIVVLIVVILGVIGSFGLVGLAMLPIIVVLVVVATYGLVQLTHLLHDSSGMGEKPTRSSSFSKTIKYMQYVYFEAAFAALLMVIGAVVGGIQGFQGYKEATPEGSINAFNVFNELVVYGLCGLNGAFTLYVYRFLRVDVNFSRSGSKEPPHSTVISDSKGTETMNNMI